MASDRFRAATFAAVGSEDFVVGVRPPHAHRAQIQWVGSGNFEAGIFYNNFDNDTDWTLCTTQFGVATITAFGSYVAVEGFVPHKIRVHVTSVQASRTVKLALGY